MNANLPDHDQTVIFTRIPLGSYCSPGVPYRVSRLSKHSTYFTRVKNGSSTWDPNWAVAKSEWSLVPDASPVISETIQA